MKTLLLILLLIPTLVEARNVNIVVGQPTTVVTPDHCSSCTSLACEDFETGATGYLCTTTPHWDENVSKATVNQTAAHSGTFSACNDEGTQCLEVDFTDTGSDGNSRLDLGSAQGTLYIQFYINIVDSGISAGQAMPFLVLHNGSDVYHSFMRANYASASTFTFQTRILNNACSGNISSSVSAAKNEDTWYRIRIEYVKATPRFRMWVDDSLVTDETDVCAQDLRYIYFGNNDSDNSSTGKVQFDNIKVSSSAMPGACE